MSAVGLVAASGGMFAGFSVSPLPASGHLPPQAGEGMVSVSAAGAVALSGVFTGFAASSGVVTRFSAWAIFSTKVAPPTVSMDGVPSGVLSAPSPAGGGRLGWGCFRLVAAMSCGCGIGSAAWIKAVVVSSGMFAGFAASSGVFAGFVASSGVFAGFAASSEVVTGFTPSSEVVEVFVVVAGVFVTPTQTPPPWGRGFSGPMLLGVASAGFVWWAEAHPTVSVDGVPSDVFIGFCCFSSAIR